MPPIPAAPTTELGAPTRIVAPAGTLFGATGVIFDEREQNRDLTWPRSTKTYASMLNDAQVDGLYRGMTWPIRAYDWYLEPNGARPEVVERISRDYNLPVGRGATMDRRRTQRRFRFDGHLEDALRGIVYGHYFFEQLFEVLQDGQAAVNGGWAAHLRKLAPRPPYTISAIQPARDGGLDYIKVPALNPNDGRGIPFDRDVKLPVDRLVAYVWDKEGANWRGRSMLRSLYRPWKVKDKVVRVGAINIERAGGVPYAIAQEGAGPQEMADLQAIATSFRVGDNSGAALPHGAELKFASAAGGAEAAAYVRLQNEEMARAWLLMFMQLGGGGGQNGGSRALAEPLVDYVSLGQQVVAGWVASTFNEHVIEDDVDLNEGPGEEYAPLLAFAPKGDPLAGVQGALDDAAGAGALPADSQVMAMVRTARAGVGGHSHQHPFRRPVTAATDGPAGHEQFTDWTDLDATWRAARDQLIEAWLVVRDGQIDHLSAQIEAAGDDLEALAAIAATAGSTDADEIAVRLRDMADFGVRTARDEATAQGHSLPAPAMSDVQVMLEARAQAVAGLLTRALSEAAARQAVQRTGGALAPTEVATEVADHLRGLSNAYLEEQLGGALTAGLNTGRRTAMGGAPAGTRFFASELLDTNTCGPCSLRDGHEYDDLVTAEADYPVGGYHLCDGGVRCRGTLVAIYPESAPSVQ
jgi:hypothetical protein